MNRLLLTVLVSGLLAGCGAPAQSSECKQMLECANALEPGSGDSAFADSYGAEGTCWLTSSAADACTQTCKSLMEGYAGRPNAPEACK